MTRWVHVAVGGCRPDRDRLVPLRKMAHSSARKSGSGAEGVLEGGTGRAGAGEARGHSE